MQVSPERLTAIAMRLEQRRRRMLEESAISADSMDAKLQYIRNGYLIAATRAEVGNAE